MRSYSDRIHAYALSDKYKSEMNFMMNIMASSAPGNILDYGCGNGLMAKELLAHGYDINNYNRYLPGSLYRNDLNFAVKFGSVYFMHSIAHIKNLSDSIDKLIPLLLPTANIYICTPNGVVFEGKIEGVDETAKHYMPGQLEKVFEGKGFSTIFSGQFGEQHGYNHDNLFLKFKYVR